MTATRDDHGVKKTLLNRNRPHMAIPPPEHVETTLKNLQNMNDKNKKLKCFVAEALKVDIICKA
jgi:hypothetical protein